MPAASEAREYGNPNATSLPIRYVISGVNLESLQWSHHFFHLF